jgi:mannosyltransferase
VWELLTVYPGSNNHLLNTLLVKAGITWFGEKEWAIRLPAVIFGTATIPACYWLARMAMSTRASLAAALLLAVSYHHIFYSQNARGYSAYLLFSMISTGLLIRGMQEDRARTWLLYIACMVLNFASLLISGYVFAAHILLGVGTLVWMKRQGKRTQPMMRRLAGVFFAAGLLVFQLYSVVLPQAYGVMHTIWTQKSSGFQLFSLDFVRELARGMSAGFGPIFMVAALPALLIGGAGLFGLFRRNWMLTLGLILPWILNVLFLLANRLTIAPRFLILALPLALLASLRGLEMAGGLAARWFGSNRAGFAAWFLNLTVAVMCAGSLLSLTSYYAAPKQDFRSAIRYLQRETGPEDLIIVLDLAESGFRYYGPRTGFMAWKDYYAADSLQALDALLSAHPGKRILLATTLFYLLEIDHPEMADRIRKSWTPLRDFPGTLGGGSIRIWVSR